MGESGYNISPVVLPNLWGTPGQALQGAIQHQERQKERQYEIDYRHQKDAEADQWRKLNLIQELTDLSKHQTGSDVANALGNTLMSDVYQKYTSSADKMSPIELQANIQKDMSGIITGMEGAKNELAMADDAMKGIKQAYPNIDTATLYDHLRKDVVSRRLKDDMSGFKNEMEVQPTQFDLSDPNILSEYLTNTKGLDEEIANPKGIDPISVAAGNDDRHIEYGGKIPYWMQPNYTDEQLKKGGGFLPNGFIPKLSIKSELLPTDMLPALQGQQRNVVTSDVHKQLKERYPLEVLAGTKRMFPTYNKMNDGEKELAERDYLYNKIQTLDKSALNYKSSKTPSASMLKLWMGGGSGGDGGNNTKIQGNVFDGVADGEFSNMTIKDGVFYNKDGTPKTGIVFLSGEKIPTAIKSVLKSGSIDPELLMKGVNAEVKDGKIMSIYNKYIGSVSREDMEGIYQPKFDTEPLKGRRLVFPNTNQPKENNLPPQPEDKGATELKKNNDGRVSMKYSNETTGTYNGKKVKIGMKNGKWYNTETGQELK
jgi:hypothetical protein